MTAARTAPTTALASGSGLRHNEGMSEGTLQLYGAAGQVIGFAVNATRTAMVDLPPAFGLHAIVAVGPVPRGRLAFGIGHINVEPLTKGQRREYSFPEGVCPHGLIFTPRDEGRERAEQIRAMAAREVERAGRDLPGIPPLPRLPALPALKLPELRIDLPVATVLEELLNSMKRNAPVFPPRDAPQVAHRIEEAPPMKETAYTIAVPCARPGCGHTTVYPLGTVDPKEGTCAHEFAFDWNRGARGAFVCRGCKLAVPLTAFSDAGISPEKRYDKKGNELADVATSLEDENRTVLAENARLRRELDTLKRKARR